MFLHLSVSHSVHGEGLHTHTQGGRLGVWPAGVSRPTSRGKLGVWLGGLHAYNQGEVGGSDWRGSPGPQLGGGSGTGWGGGSPGPQPGGGWGLARRVSRPTTGERFGGLAGGGGGSQHALRQTPPGTHPTGMHSCCTKLCLEWSKPPCSCQVWVTLTDKLVLVSVLNFSFIHIWFIILQLCPFLIK